MTQGQETNKDAACVDSPIKSFVKALFSVAGPAFALACVFFLGSMYNPMSRPAPSPKTLKFSSGGELVRTVVRVGNQSFSYFSKRKPTAQELEKLKQDFTNNPPSANKHKSVVYRRVTVRHSKP